MAGHIPVITKQVCSAETGLGPDQPAKSVGQVQNTGGVCNHTCSMSQAQNQDDSLILSPAPSRRGEGSPKRLLIALLKAFTISELALGEGSQILRMREDACW